MKYEEFLERVRSKTIEVGDCWEWDGATTQGVPMMWDPVRGMAYYTRRLIAMYRGDYRKAMRYVPGVCDNPKCVNPDHITGRTPSSVAKAAAKKNGTRHSWSANISAGKRKSSKLNQEVVDQIRAAEGTNAAIGREFSLHPSTVGAIRRYEIWRDYSSPFSSLLG